MAPWLPKLPASVRGLIGRSRGQAAIGRRRSLLAPRWLASVDAQMNVLAYRIRLRWNGRRTLATAPLPVGEPCYVVLHPDLPFRRKLQRFPAQAKAREVLLRAAPDEFPLADDAVSYCMGLRQGEAYVYAMPGKLMEQLHESGLQPDIVLVGAADSLDEADCLAALEAYERFGSSLAFGGRRRPLPRRWLLDASLAGGAAIALALTIWLALGADPFAEFLNGRLDRLRTETAMVAGQYAAAESMLATRNQLARLRENPGGRLPNELANLWREVPAGHAIRRIDYKEGLLAVSGSGTEVGHWLQSSGFPAEQIKTETIGKLSRFRAERDLGR
jgi:hypothetical protein